MGGETRLRLLAPPGENSDLNIANRGLSMVPNSRRPGGGVQEVIQTGEDTREDLTQFLCASHVLKGKGRSESQGSRAVGLHAVHSEVGGRG